MSQTEAGTDFEALRAACPPLAEERDRLRLRFNELLNARDEASKFGRASAYLSSKRELDELRAAGLECCARLDAAHDKALSAYMEGWVTNSRALGVEARRIGEARQALEAQLRTLNEQYEAERERIKPEQDKLDQMRRDVERWIAQEQQATAQLMKLLTE